MTAQRSQAANDAGGQFELLTVVVPLYNEARTVRESLERLMKAELPLPIEILVVDDGSDDDSLAAIEDLESNGDIRVVRHGRNLGKGRAVRTGIEQASGDLLTIYDADLEYDPSDYAALLEPIMNGDARVTYGTRTFGSHTAFSFWYVIGNRLVTLFASFLFNSWLSDIETCFKISETRIWRALQLSSNGSGIEPEATAKFLKHGYRIYEHPIRYTARTREEGKKLRARDGIEALWILLVIRLFGRRTLVTRR